MYKRSKTVKNRKSRPHPVIANGQPLNSRRTQSSVTVILENPKNFQTNISEANNIVYQNNVNNISSNFLNNIENINNFNTITQNHPMTASNFLPSMGENNKYDNNNGEMLSSFEAQNIKNSISDLRHEREQKKRDLQRENFKEKERNYVNQRQYKKDGFNSLRPSTKEAPAFLREFGGVPTDGYLKRSLRIYA